MQSFSLTTQDRLLTYQVLNSAVPRSTLLIASINIVSEFKRNPNVEPSISVILNRRDASRYRDLEAFLPMQTWKFFESLKFTKFVINKKNIIVISQYSNKVKIYFSIPIFLVFWKKKNIFIGLNLWKFLSQELWPGQ